MKMLKRAIVMITTVALAACGGSGDAGSSLYGGGSSGSSSATAIDVIASDVQVGSGGDKITITATVKGAGNVGLASAPVSFSTSSGTLTSAVSVSDTNGLATASLSAGADKSNRDITVTVTSGSATGQIVLPVTGTTLTYVGASTVPLSKTASVGVKATDSKNNLITGLPVTVASSLNNGLSATSATTNSQGIATLTYTATNAGTDSLSFAGGNANLAQSVQISSENFTFVSPASDTVITVNAPQVLTVQYLSNGVAQVGKTILFTSTAGTVTPSALTDSTGSASVSITSAIAGPALVQASVSGIAAQATLNLQFVAQAPSKLVLQASPTAIGPNASGSTTQQAQLVATVTDAAGNVVQGATVNFNRVADPSGGSLNQATATTDASGQATVQYIAGPLTTASNGVQFRATVASATSVFGDATLTVNQSALFIALGTGNVIDNLDPQTYKKDWVVYVTDANGVAVPNINLTIKVLPVQYAKGSLSFGTFWDYSANVQVCDNEDANYNGILDSGEDFNGSGTLEPGNVISVSTSGSASSSSSGTVKTDSTGRATVSLIYAESYAPWVKVKLRAEAIVSGTESSKEAIFWVSGSTADFSSATTPPAGRISPFGTNACSVPN